MRRKNRGEFLGAAIAGAMGLVLAGGAAIAGAQKAPSGAAARPVAPQVKRFGTPIPVKNGDFEATFRNLPPKSKTAKGDVTGRIADGWDDNSDWAELAVAYNDERKIVHTGRSAQRIELKTIKNGQAQFAQNFDLDTGKTYRLSAYLCTPDETKIEWGLRRTGEPYNYFGSEKAKIGPVWQKVTVTVRLTEAPPTTLMLIVRTPSTVFMDDVTLEEGD